LPPADTVRWSPQRKAFVVAAVQDGAISFEEACQRYELSAEELLAWQHAKQAYGIGALRVTRFQCYRDVPRTK
jgi:transposase-like protein